MKINDIVMEKTEDPRSEVKRREQFRTGGGTHKDRKKAAKRGEAKHKKQAVPMEGVSEENAVSEALPALPLVIAAGARATPWLVRQGAKVLSGGGRAAAATPRAVSQVGTGVGRAGVGAGAGYTGKAAYDTVQAVLGSEAARKVLRLSAQYGLPILAMVAILYGGKEVIEYLRDRADRKNQHSADEFDIDKKQGVAEGPFTGIGKMMMKHKLKKGIKRDHDAADDALDIVYDYDFDSASRRYEPEDAFAKAYDAKKRKERALNRLSKKEGVAEAGRGFRGRSSWDSNMWSGDLGSRDKRSFKRREMEKELGHEDDPDFERKMRMSQDKGPWYLLIDGKIYKQKGQPKAFDWKKGANNYGLAIVKNKPELKGKVLLTKVPKDLDKSDSE